MAELVWIHRLNANELGLSEDGGTGRGSFVLVPVDAHGIFPDITQPNIEGKYTKQCAVYFTDLNQVYQLNYHRPTSKTEHRLSFGGLSEAIGFDTKNLLSPGKIICIYRKDSTINLSVVDDNSVYARLLNDFPQRGRTNNLITSTVFNSSNSATQVLNQAPKNLLLYGVAGVGKSYYVNQQLNNLNGENEHRIERVVFHPDYLNADFVGQILPTVKKDIGITYEFKAGPFTRILKKAFDNPDQHHYLVIEEINRGNAPAIFGEIFQLLDRNSRGESEYKISNDLIAGYINSTLDKNSDSEVSNGNLKIQNNMIYIPSNLSIYATMNTADQNVFTLDTAFQRRWTMQMMENNIEQCGFRNEVIGDTGVTWEKFNTELNKIILQSNKNTLSSEDKRLGAYFVKPHELTIQDGSCLFAEKVIKYLWDDVFKFKKSELFRDDLDSLDQVLNEFKNEKFNIFVESVRDTLLNSPKPSTEDVADTSSDLGFVNSGDENEQ